MTVHDQSGLEFCRAFEQLGYARVEGDVPGSQGDRLYVWSESLGDVRHYARLGFKPKTKTYGLSVAASSTQAMRLLRTRYTEIAKYLRPELIKSSWNLANRPCWTYFDVGIAMDWTYLAIPNPLDRSTWPALLSEAVEKFLRPNFWNVADASSVRDLLMRADKPFEWFGSNAVLRVAEFLAVSRVMGEPRASAHEFARSVERHVKRDLVGAADASMVINELVEHFSH